MQKTLVTRKSNMASASFSFVLAREPGHEFLFPRRYSEAILLLRECSRKHKKKITESVLGTEYIYSVPRTLSVIILVFTRRYSIISYSYPRRLSELFIHFLKHSRTLYCFPEDILGNVLYRNRTDTDTDTDAFQSHNLITSSLTSKQLNLQTFLRRLNCVWFTLESNNRM